MEVVKAHRTELKPTKAQEVLLRKHIGTARFTYNWGLARRIEEYKLTGKSSSAITQHKQLNELKDKEFPWMYEVSKCAPQEALRDLDKAYEGFFRNVKAGKKPGFPKFKSRYGSKQSYRLNSKFKITETHVFLPTVGAVRLKEHAYLPTDKTSMLSTTVSLKAGHWFISVQYRIEKEIPTLKLEQPVGIDVGLTDFAVLSTGESVPHPKFLKKATRRIKMLSRRLSKKQKGSKNKAKARIRLSRLHYRVANKRRDFLHKLSTRLAITKPFYVLETLQVANMQKNHRLARAISDSGWAEFGRMLTYKCEWKGGLVTRAPKSYPSTKRCFVCGEVKQMSLSDRVYRCASCGNECSRDLNSAMNLAQVRSVRPDLKPVERTARKASLGSRKLDKPTLVAFGK